MLEHRRTIARACGLLTVLSLVACDASTADAPTEAQKRVAAEKEAKDAEAAAAVAAGKAKRDAEKKAEEEAAKKLADELARICVLPEKMPKDPVAACEAVGQAHDAFIRRVGSPEAVAEWDAGGKEKVIPMSVVQCSQADSLEAAACQGHALEAAGPDMVDQTKIILQTCIDNFPGRRRGGAPVLKQRPG
jgi:colicin import membrane protein